jgi:hypothetical protein
MFGACQTKASCGEKKKEKKTPKQKQNFIQYKDSIAFKETVAESGVVMKDIIQDVDFAKARLLHKKNLSRCARVLARNTPIYFYHSEFGKRIFFNKKWLTTNEDVACKKILRCTNRAPIMDFEEHNLTKLSINGIIR